MKKYKFGVFLNPSSNGRAERHSGNGGFEL
jgi:hypothetical protein